MCVFLLNAASSLCLLRLGLEEEEEKEKLDMAVHTCNPSGLMPGVGLSWKPVWAAWGDHVSVTQLHK